MARAPFAAWRPIPSATDPKIVPIGVILHVDAGATLPIRASEATRRTVTYLGS